MKDFFTDDDIEGIKCPRCSTELIKRKKQALGVKFCDRCGISWFIVECRKYRRDKSGRWIK